MSAHTPLLKKLGARYVFTRVMEVLLVALAAAILTWAISGWITSDEIGRSIAIGVASILMAFLGTIRTKVLVPQAPFLIHYLNNRYPQLQASADLLLKAESSLSLIQKIQLTRVQTQLEKFTLK